MNKYNILKALMDEKLRILLILGVLFIVNTGMVFGGTEGMALVKDTLACLICKITTLLLYVAGGIAALVMVIAGIRWVGSGEDPGARTAAKGSIISAIVGLIIIILAVFIVTWLLANFGQMNQVNLIDWIRNGCSGIEGCET